MAGEAEPRDLGEDRALLGFDGQSVWNEVGAERND